MHLPLAANHMTIVPSSEAVAMKCPSLENVADKLLPVIPTKEKLLMPVFEHQTLADPSEVTPAICCPQAEKLADSTGPVSSQISVPISTLQTLASQQDVTLNAMVPPAAMADDKTR